MRTHNPNYSYYQFVKVNKHLAKELFSPADFADFRRVFKPQITLITLILNKPQILQMNFKCVLRQAQGTAHELTLIFSIHAKISNDFL